MQLTTDKTALIVVDMQNGFCHDRGSFAGLGLDISLLKGAIPGCARLVGAAQAASVPVIFTRVVEVDDVAAAWAGAPVHGV